MSVRFILFNGNFSPANDKLFDYKFLNNTMLKIEVLSVKSVIPFWNEHIKLINFKLKLHKVETPSLLKKEGTELKRQIERTLTKNKLFNSARISIHFLIYNGQVSYLIQASDENHAGYDLNKEGLIVEIFKKVPKAVSPLSSLSEGSSPYWEIMKKHQKTGIELLLTNTNESIIEGLQKNIYMVKGNEVLTPSAATGSYIDISSTMIKTACKNLNMNFSEVNQLNATDLLNADEIFLCNSIRGIEWVKGFKDKRFFCKKTRLISGEFKRLLIQ